MTRPREEFDEIEATRTLVDFMSAPSYRPMLQRELLHRAHVPGPERGSFRKILRRLIRQGRIRKLRGGRLVMAGPTDARKGRLVEKTHARMLGIYFERGRSGSVQPLDPARGETILVRAADRAKAADWEAVAVEIVKAAKDGRAAEGKVVERLGKLGAPGTDVRVVSHRYQLAGEFGKETLARARKLPGKIGPEEAKGRERFDDPSPVTIDGETARDFDDAIAVLELPRGGFRLWVHIADVSHFVKAGDPIDLEARSRGTSVYFPEKVIPMLPEALSNDLCSLVPGEDRLVQSAVMEFSAKGAMRKVRFADGIIHSAARLTYTQVGALLEGKKRGHGVPAAVVPMLKSADRLREVLERRRHARGSIDFDLPEPQILLDVEGAMTGITIQPRNLAHRLIEEFMLAANEAVAGQLAEREQPAVYRVHDPPDPTKLDSLVRFVEGFGHELRAHDAPTVSKEIQQLLEQVEGLPEERVINQVALRTMNQARYAPENAGHFALAAPDYTHFTSPIRRYPDLIVHRQLRALRKRKGAMPHEEGELGELAESSSNLERNAEAAERELLAWKKVAFISDHVGESFDGIVTGVTRFGLFVQLVENLVEGLVRIELLGHEWFDYDERRHELIGSQSGKHFRLGDRMRVTVTRVDRIRQRVDMTPEGEVEPAPRRPRPTRRRGRGAYRRR